MDRKEEILQKLKSLSREQFCQLLFLLEIPAAELPDDVSQTEKAIEIYYMLQAQQDGLKRLEEALEHPSIKILSSQSAANPIKARVDEIVSDYTQLFVGRDEEEQQLDDFLTENSSGMLLVRAGAGMGKTALLANWKQKQQQQGNCFIAYHFFRQGEDTSNVIQAYRYLLRQLYTYYELITQPIPTSEYELKELICNHLQEPRKEKPLVILLDALDEATPERSLSLTLPQPLPEGLYVIASVRVNEEEKLDNLPPWIQVTKDLPLEHLPSPAIAEWLRRAGNGKLATLAQDDTFVEQVCDRTEGIPLFLKYLIDELVQVAKQGEESAIRNTLAATPKGFAEYIRQQYQALDRLEDWRSRRELRKIFYFLTIAKGELSSYDFRKLIGESPVGLPWQVSRWFKIREIGNSRLFSFNHSTLAEQFAALSEINENTEESQEKLLEYCANWQKHQKSRYALRHYAEHLRDVKQWEELYAIARHKNFAFTQRQQLPDEPDLPLKTVQLALQGAAETDDAGGMAEFLLLHAQRLMQTTTQESPLEALRAGSLERAWKLAEQFEIERCILWYLLLAWVLATDATRDNGIKQAGETLERLQKMDLPRLSHSSHWIANDAVYALTHILAATKGTFTELSKRILDDSRLANLCEDLTEGGNFTAALTTAHQIKHPNDRARALIAIAKAQPTAENFAAALHTAQQIDFGYHRALALVEIAKAQAQAENIAAALHTAQQIDFSWGQKQQAEVFLEIAKAQAQAENFAAALTTAQQIEYPDDRARALIAIAKAQPTEENFAAALHTAQQIYFWHQAEVFLEIAKAQAQAENFAAALTTAQLIKDSFQRARALIAIAKAQPTEENFAAALHTAQQIDSWQQAEVFLEIAKAQPTEENFAAALTTAQLIENSFQRGRALVAIAKAQAQAENFAAALTTAQLIDDSDDRAEVFLEIAKAQPTEENFAAALTTAQLIEDSFQRGSALVAIAKAQPTVENFATVLTTAHQMEYSSEPAEALLAIAKAQAQAENFAAALATAHQIDNSRLQAEALLEIAKAQAQAENFAAALTTAQLIEDSFQRVPALIEIAKAQAQAENFAAALTTAQLIEDSFQRGRALIEIAKAQAQAENFAAALTAAQLIEDSFRQRSEVFLEIAKAQAQTENFAAALTTAHQIEYPDDQARALIAIAKAQAQTENFAAALATAHQIDKSRLQAEALLEIAKAQPTAENFAAALTTAQLIEDSFQRVPALIEIAKAQPTEENFAAALHTAQQIRGRFGRAQALTEIAKAQAQAENFTAALTTAHQIDDSDDRAKALIEIAKAQPTAENFAAALTTAHQIDDSDDRAKALIEIAKAQPIAENFAAALTTAHQIDDSDDRVNALIEIAKAQPTAENFAAALTTAHQIDDSDDRVNALFEIAKAQVKATLGEQALLTAEKIFINRNKHLPDIAAAFVETGDKKNFKQLLIPCAYYLDAAYQVCGYLAKLYPAQATAVAKVVSNMNKVNE